MVVQLVGWWPVIDFTPHIDLVGWYTFGIFT
jgi:hypothetical protein